MEKQMINDELIKKILESSRTIAMIGVSSIKKEISSNIKRRPSTIVMKYMQEFGYRVTTYHGEREREWDRRNR